MIKLFQYNWQVRNEWFDWCAAVPEEELLKERVGVKSALLCKIDRRVFSLKFF